MRTIVIPLLPCQVVDLDATTRIRFVHGAASSTAANTAGRLPQCISHPRKVPAIPFCLQAFWNNHHSIGHAPPSPCGYCHWPVESTRAGLGGGSSTFRGVLFVQKVLRSGLCFGLDWIPALSLAHSTRHIGQTTHTTPGISRILCRKVPLECLGLGLTSTAALQLSRALPTAAEPSTTYCCFQRQSGRPSPPQLASHTRTLPKGTVGAWLDLATTLLPRK